MKSIRFNRSVRMFVGALLAVMALALARDARAELSFVLTNSRSAAMPRRPNIILIMADGLGYGDLSGYGQTKFQTPNLDRLAANGIRFTSYYAGDAASSPARAALMLGRDSGRLPQRADVDVPLAADDVTIAQVLKQSGYHTGLIGEWDLGGDGTTGAPWSKGFDEFAGYFNVTDPVNYYADFIRRYDPRVHFNKGTAAVYDNFSGKRGKYIPDLFITMATNYVRNNQPDWANHYRPFFLVLNYMMLRANPDEAARNGNGLQVPSDAPFSGEPWPQVEKNKAAMIMRLDDNLGKLLDQLRGLRQESNTVIFFTSDTGPQTNNGTDPKFFRSAGPFRGSGGELYEGGLRVPLIVSWPGRIPAGQVSDRPCAAWDFLPTAAGIAMTQSPTNIDGISLLAALLGQKPASQHEFFHWQLRGQNVWHTVRMDNWEVVQSKPDAPPELYDLKTDPGETNNVAGQHPDVITKFQDILKNSR